MNRRRAHFPSKLQDLRIFFFLFLHISLLLLKIDFITLTFNDRTIMPASRHFLQLYSFIVQNCLCPFLIARNNPTQIYNSIIVTLDTCNLDVAKDKMQRPNKKLGLFVQLIPLNAKFFRHLCINSYEDLFLYLFETPKVSHSISTCIFHST